MATATAFPQYSNLPERTVVGVGCCLSNGHAAAGSTGFSSKTLRSERRSLNTTSLGSIFGFNRFEGGLATPTFLYIIKVFMQSLTIVSLFITVLDQE